MGRSRHMPSRPCAWTEREGEARRGRPGMKRPRWMEAGRERTERHLEPPAPHHLKSDSHSPPLPGGLPWGVSLPTR